MNCNKSPAPWVCTREENHSGPCAAIPADDAFMGWSLQECQSCNNPIERFLNRTRKITLADLAIGHNTDYLLRNTMEELGEYSAALTIESGIKQKPLKESSRQEAIDVIICALSLFYASGGENKELAEYGMTKLNKWEDRVENGKVNEKI